MILSDPVCYCINSISMGDVIATAPIIKYAINNFHTNTDYKVLVKSCYNDFFTFVPNDKLGDQGEQHSFTPPWMVRNLNTPKSKNARITSMHMHLTTFASIQLLNRIIPQDQRSYIDVPKVDIGHFDIDFSKAILIVVTYRDDVRRIPLDTVKGVTDWVLSQGLLPVYIGKLDDSAIWGNAPFRLSFDALPENGINLLNKTSLRELVSIMANSIAVIGLDSGLIHLAGTTSVPIVCGFTNVAAEHRFPIRSDKTIFIPIKPSVQCSHCQSYWNLHYHDFGYCYFKHAKCVEQMSADKFIKALSFIISKNKE